MVPTKYTTKQLLSMYTQKSEKFWLTAYTKSKKELFLRMAKQVPAYKKFLKDHNIQPGQAIQDILSVPAMLKKNYFFRHPLTDVAWKNAYKTEVLVMTSTSGSTGNPVYFPRNGTVDWRYSVLAEFFINNGPSGTTLLIDCFGMGVWIGGLITYQAFRTMALRGNPVTVITPGINKKEIFHCLKNLAPNFDNVILAGYPPFIKDILDEATEEEEGIDFKKFNTRLLFAAESFTEMFRDYVCAKAHVKNIYADTLNIYGSAELGAMAFETPASILVRRLALKHPKVWKELFMEGKQPTIAQFNPLFVGFDEFNGEIAITSDNVVPFFHYKIGDNGGVHTMTTIKDAFLRHGINLKKEAQKLSIDLLNLPFVYIYARSDLSTKLYGAIIYPEHIRDALQTEPLRTLCSGKFIIETKTYKNQDQYLEINIELKKGQEPNSALAAKCTQIIVDTLLISNAEFKNNYQSIPHKVTPKIILRKFESFEHFKPGIKQKWVQLT